MIFALVMSFVLNVFLFFYLRWLLKNFTVLSDNVYSLFETIDAFSNHLSAIYEMETFYGDETLQNLLEHAKQVASEIDSYRDIYTITNDDEQIEDLFHNDEAEGTKEEEEK